MQVGFWKQYSQERVNNNGSSAFGLSKNNPRVRKYIEIKKNGDLYTGTYYVPQTTSRKEVHGYGKLDFTGSLKGSALFLDFGHGKITPIINSKSDGKIIEVTNHKKKYKIIGILKKLTKTRL